MEDEGIKHRTVSVNGVKLHVAEKGEEGRPIVLLIHGYPELWYSWRYQIHGLAAAGFRAVAPDMRGYGDSDAPPSPASYTIFHVVGDLIALIDLFTKDKVSVVGQDMGATIAWYMCLFRPDRVKALVGLSVIFIPRFPTSKKPVQLIKERYGEDHYIARFQDPEMDLQVAGIGIKTLIKLLGIKSFPGVSTWPKEGLTLPPGVELPLPCGVSEEDLDYYASKFEKTGFTGGLNYYRALDLSWELASPWVGAKVTVPCKFIVGDMDLTYNTPGCKEYIHGEGFKRDVPSLQEVVVMEETGHLINQDRHDEINAHLIAFFRNY